MAKITGTSNYTLDVSLAELALIKRGLWLDETKRDGQDCDENADLYSDICDYLDAHGICLDCLDDKN